MILDTSVIIDHLRQSSLEETVLMRIERSVHKDALAISVISVQELYEGESTRNVHKEKDLLSIITPLTVLSYDFHIAQIAGQIAREFSMPIDFADAAIAATAIVNKAVLCTLNKKHFEGIGDLELYQL